jgi:very-short-patch-repair endonuclease
VRVFSDLDAFTMALVRRQISPHASALRRNMTDVEQTLWAALRNRQLGGFKFRRQATIGRYIVDFLCAERRLIIELDGGQHSPDADAPRTAALEEAGYRVIRFWNSDVNQSFDGVIDTILGALQEERPSPNPLPQAGEG